MYENPYYHEFSASLDPQFIIWVIVSLAVVIALSMANTAVKPISFRCRGIKASGRRTRACRKVCAIRQADKNDKIAIVLPSGSWDKEFAAIWTVLACWQGMMYHGKGLYQWFCNRSYPFNDIMMAITIVMLAVISYLVVKWTIFLSIKVKVAILVRWYEINKVDVPPICEKWGAEDFFRRIAIKSRKRKKEKEASIIKGAKRTVNWQ